MPPPVYVASALVAFLGALAPNFLPGVFPPFAATRTELTLAAGAAVVAHVVLHRVFSRERRAGIVLPGLVVGAAAAAVAALASSALGWAAFVANLCATLPDVWLAFSAPRPAVNAGSQDRP